MLYITSCAAIGFMFDLGFFSSIVVLQRLAFWQLRPVRRYPLFPQVDLWSAADAI